jgi:four helix bundle protein
MTDRSRARGYEDLDVFQRALRTLKPIHELVLTFPDYEKFDLASQIRRASKSIPANLTEGYARRRSVRDSFATSRSQLVQLTRWRSTCASRLRYINEGVHQRCAEEYQITGKQLRRLIEHWSSLPTLATSDQ